MYHFLSRCSVFSTSHIIWVKWQSFGDSSTALHLCLPGSECAYAFMQDCWRHIPGFQSIQPLFSLLFFYQDLETECQEDQWSLLRSAHLSVDSAACLLRKLGLIKLQSTYLGFRHHRRAASMFHCQVSSWRREFVTTKNAGIIQSGEKGTNSKKLNYSLVS